MKDEFLSMKIIQTFCILEPKLFMSFALEPIAAYGCETDSHTQFQCVFGGFLTPANNSPMPAEYLRI